MDLTRRLAALLLLAAAALGAAADEIVLRNGDRIRGEVVALADGKLVVRTGYAGEIRVQWKDVTALSTDRPIRVMRKGERSSLHGTPQPLYDGRILLVGRDGGAVELGLDEIAYLNPQPWESGIGVAYSGRVTLAAAYTRGNTEDERLNGDGEFTARARQYRYTLSGSVDRRRDPVLGTNTAWRAGTNYDRFLEDDRFLQADRFVYGRGSLEHDRAKDLEQRAAAGVGYGAELIDTARAKLTVRGGLDYVTVERNAGPSERYPAFGWGVKAAYTPWFHENEGFWNLEDTGAVILRSRTGIRSPLAYGISLSVQLQLDWERKPAPGRKSTDSTLLVGIDYAWL